VTQLDSIVIVGGGLAGANAAIALREADYRGRLVVVGEEAHLPYERPPLSKGYLRGEEPAAKLRVKPAGDYDRMGVELLHARATGIDRGSRRVALADGSSIGYGALVLATGSAPRRLGVEGAELEGLHYLRTQDDADALRDAAHDAEAVVVVGGGWIGSEVAASLRQLGRPVTLVSSEGMPLVRVLGPEVASVYAELHRANGVELLSGSVAALEGAGRVSGVRLADGRRLAADLVVAGVGAVPRVELAADAGLPLAAGGVRVDATLRSADPRIWAIGDIAASWHPRLRRRLRVEHWENAIEQGRAVAANLVGERTAYERIPYFYSDQFDLGMEYRGAPGRWDRVVLRGDLASREFLAFWLRRRQVVAAMNANIWDAGELLADLVSRRATVDPHRLADARQPLEPAAA
jgi:3-phenylpropionate/trans-cinnamate dioxygenase ferredoxin reductase subunit